MGSLSTDYPTLLPRNSFSGFHPVGCTLTPIRKFHPDWQDRRHDPHLILILYAYRIIVKCYFHYFKFSFQSPLNKIDNRVRLLLKCKCKASYQKLSFLFVLFFLICLLQGGIEPPSYITRTTLPFSGTTPVLRSAGYVMRFAFPLSYWWRTTFMH